MPKSRNFTHEDQNRLRVLINQSKNVVENKRSDAVSLKKKKEAWEKITVQFNSSSEVTRTVDQLRRLWENIKFRRRRQLLEERERIQELNEKKGCSFSILSQPDSELNSNGLDIEIKDDLDSDSNFIETYDDEIIIRKPSGHYPNKKVKQDHFTSAETTLRVDRLKYLLDFEKNVGELKVQEAEINLQIAKTKLRILEMEEQFQGEKFNLELQVLKKKYEMESRHKFE